MCGRGCLRRAMADRGEETPWEFVDEPSEESIERWRRLVRSIYRARRLQRIWGHLGNFLQTFPSELRESLKKTFP